MQYNILYIRIQDCGVKNRIFCRKHAWATFIFPAYRIRFRIGYRYAQMGLSMDYKAIFTIEELKNHLSGATLVAFDFETAPDEKYRKEEKAALDAHKCHIVGISFSVAEGTGVYLPLTHRIGRNAEKPNEIWNWLTTEFFHNTAAQKEAVGNFGVNIFCFSILCSL